MLSDRDSATTDSVVAAGELPEIAIAVTGRARPRTRNAFGILKSHRQARENWRTIIAQRHEADPPSWLRSLSAGEPEVVRLAAEQ